jgi:KipI family sensor histidine kinase inhibitor
VARSVPVGEVRRLGDHAVLVGVHDPAAARRLAGALRGAGQPGVLEVVGGLATVMVAFDPEEDPGGDAGRWRPWLVDVMNEAVDRPGDEGGGQLLTIPCLFDGPDLAEVAEAAGCTPAAVVELVTSRHLTVAAVGFSPGFAYLSGLPEELRHVPRRDRPRPVVPAGSVALANGYAAVYPSASPGGWQLIGRTGTPLFTPLVPPYARLAPGDRVRFVAAHHLADVEVEEEPPAPGPAEPADSPGARPAFMVEEPGLRTALQDGGRRGVAALGVPAAGPGDPYSFTLANRLVGNRDDACALEVTARGPRLLCLNPVFVAVVGAAPDLLVNGQPVSPGRVVPLAAGQRLEVGSVRRGLRCYLAVSGGLVGTAVLGSCATDQLAGLGPGTLARGATVWVAPMRPPLGDHLGDDPSQWASGDAVALRVVPGPHPEWFVPGAMAALASVRYRVEPASNRVGLRLVPEGAPPALLAGGSGELDSHGVVTGAVQVPPHGDPVILLPDHATMGGYPVVAVVATADHGLLGQCAPGAVVTLVPISFEEADDALRARRRAVATAVVGHYPVEVE